MPPKTNQFKQGAQPPKATPSKGPVPTAEMSSLTTSSDTGDRISEGPKPLHLLLRTANKVLLQTLTRAPNGSSVTASSSSTDTGTPPAPTSSLTMAEPITVFKDADFSECDAIISKTGDFAVVASSTDVRIIFLKEIFGTSAAGKVSDGGIQSITIAEDKVCHLMFSPLETFLVTYRMRDPKRPTEGNMAVYNLQTIFENFTSAKKNTSAPSPVLKCVQGAWPAIVWTPNEEYCVRYAKGLLMLHEGIIKGGDDAADLEDGGEDEAVTSPNASKSSTGNNGPRCKIELQLPQNKEPVFETAPLVVPVSDMIPNTHKIPALEQIAKALPPLFVLFKPHNKNQPASLGVYRLPMFREPMFSIQLQRAEGAHLEWNRNATHICVISKQETEKGDNSYYAKTNLVLVNLRDRKDLVVKFPGVSTVGAGATYEAVHDVKWSPTRDEFIVVHGTMPRNKATLYNDKGQALFQFGEAPRNLSFWSPNGSMFVIGGTGSLVGEFQFYHRDGLDNKTKPAITAGQRPSSAAAPSELGGKLGSFNEKSSEQSWSPDSRFMLCSTVFSKLRIDNKFFVFKHNGERCCESKFKTEDGSLYQATWIPMPAGYYGQPRPPSPTVSAAQAPPKPALFKARGAGNAAISAALSRAPLASAATAAKPAGLLPGENPIAPKTKGRR